MSKYDVIAEIINSLISSGSEISYLKELRDKSIDLTNRDIDLKEILFNIGNDIQVYTEMFLSAKNEYDVNLISGISTGIYLPDYENGGYKFKILGGNTKRDGGSEINDETLFDVASITKIYTLILLFKLEELGLIDLNKKVNELNPDIQGLEDYTLNDLVRLHGILRTYGNITTASSYEEAYERFKTVYLYDTSRDKNTYTDFGAMVIGDTIEKVISNLLGENLKIDEIMNRYLFIPLYINNTTFTPGIINVTGNNNNLGLPHDPKSRILGGKTGHAGVFTNSDDLNKLADALFEYNYLNKEYICKLGEITFNSSSKGNLGVYVKHPKGWDYTYTAPEFSKDSFSHQGWTGAVASFDPNNKIHNNILVNAIYESENSYEIKNNKPVGFSKQFGLYQSEITKRIMLMYVIKKYYNKYIGYKESIDDSRVIR